ncbi:MULTISPECIES: YhdH/YhfP family quinone oxidoreductase [Enterococcus]|uniref:Rhodanese domain-containing protein n=1 Tax=Enterococcus sulfureus ATCC 49903 TaxID=1140003 RepID=S0L4T4_9ENTE|nr:YhdH/YhfP family quinone oxidoreductase [Enterococcus sulfureus]EOT46516.1 hypothetical protein OMY_01665 [Enterococcus sulfureus ATCC 49903]EOT86171.1 hypothetical protein I573_00924 [Enterococcus sulfureus ATCC 49903]
MNSFKALVVNEQQDQIQYTVEDTLTLEDLSNGEVVIKVHYSSTNYKDMLAVQKNGGVIRNYPMIPGIDLSGEIVESTDPRFVKGQEVLVTGYKMGMSHTGGFSEYARVPADWVISLPKDLTTKDAMILGTAGLTAALSIAALEKNGMDATKEQTILVTGATGGVGSLAVQMLAKAGYKHIVALVRKEHQLEVAQTLGATETILLSEFDFEKKPLAKQQFHYILDTVGGDLVASLLPYVFYEGSVSLCGNAGGVKLTTTVLPFILRGINLLGIDSVNISHERRVAMWQKMATDWKVTDTTLVNETSLAGLPTVLEQLKAGQHLGRTIVNISK